MTYPISLGIIVPSHRPIEFYDIFLKSLPHLRAGLPLGDVDVKVLLAAQASGWTHELLQEISRFCSALDIDFRYIFCLPRAVPRMCELRQSAANLYPEATYYMLADSNMQFQPFWHDDEVAIHESSGSRYAAALRYMERFPRCGSVQCHTSDPKRIGTATAPTANGLVTTAKGLLLRNLFHGKVWPRETLEFSSSLEETVAVYRIMEQGYFPARQHLNPTYHPIHKIGADEGLHSHELIYANAGRWVRERYQDPTWDHEAERFPAALVHKMVMNGNGRVSINPFDRSFR